MKTVLIKYKTYHNLSNTNEKKTIIIIDKIQKKKKGFIYIIHFNVVFDIFSQFVTIFQLTIDRKIANIFTKNIIIRFEKSFLKSNTNILMFCLMLNVLISMCCSFEK